MVPGSVLDRDPEMDVPLPLASIPVNIAVLSLVQVNVVPTVPLGFVIFMGVRLPSGQIVWVRGEADTVGMGFTVMVKVSGVPVQPLAVGVTVMVALMGALVVLVAVKAAIFPDPLAASPMAVLSLVQLKVVPATSPVKAMAVVGAPAHRV